MLTNLAKMKSRHQTIFAIIIAFAIVCFWRGAWGLLDTYLVPGNYVLSSWLSLLIGLAILVGTHYASKELI